MKITIHYKDDNIVHLIHLKHEKKFALNVEEDFIYLNLLKEILWK